MIIIMRIPRCFFLDETCLHNMEFDHGSCASRDLAQVFRLALQLHFVSRRFGLPRRHTSPSPVMGLFPAFGVSKDFVAPMECIGEHYPNKVCPKTKHIFAPWHMSQGYNP